MSPRKNPVIMTEEHLTSLLRLGVDSELAKEVQASPLGDDQRITMVNDEIWVDVSMVFSPDLLHWIQSMGSRVEVLHPPHLREQVRQDLVRALRKYRLV
jgi:predicted DNA-binding transcriptional regulator YafY